jgi:serine/threonine-protein kinase HipA
MSSRSREELVVLLDAPEIGPARPVGVLTRWPGTRPAISFQYARSWLTGKDAFALDPRLPLVDDDRYMPQSRIPPSLADTSPDTWGEMLLTRRAGRHLSAWELLTAVADETRMGALRLRRGVDGPFIDDREPAVPPVAELRALQAAARAVEDDPDAPVEDPLIAFLIAPGSSLGGARPKSNFRDTDGSLWIAKFPSRGDRQDIGAWELVYARLARAAGIDVADTELLSLGGRGRTFITRRFDRMDDGGRRLFVSAMTMADKDDGDAAGYPDLALAISDNVAAASVRRDLAQMFRRLVFNIVAGNRDDHLRNHGFLRTAQGWRLAPAFDMNPAREAREHSLAVDGRTNAADVRAALETHRLYGLSETDARRVIHEVATAVSDWHAEARRAGIGEAEQRVVGAAFIALRTAMDLVGAG